MTTYISTNFTLEEASDSDIASREGIDNDIPPELIENVKRAAYGMEEVRTELGDNVILVSSWYRCEALERIVARKGYESWCAKRGLPLSGDTWRQYFLTKSHPKGLSVDFKAPTFGTPREIVHRLVGSNLKYRQVILEFNRWVHIDFSGEDRVALIIDSTGTRAFA
jgi:hypothetical protein